MTARVRRNHTNKILIWVLLFILLLHPHLTFMQEPAELVKDPVSLSDNLKGQSPFLKNIALVWAISGREYQKPDNRIKRGLPQMHAFVNGAENFVVPEQAEAVILDRTRGKTGKQKGSSINRRAPPVELSYQKHIIRQSRGEADYGKLS